MLLDELCYKKEINQRKHGHYPIMSLYSFCIKNGHNISYFCKIAIILYYFCEMVIILLLLL